MPTPPFENCVFINCPFDKEYKPIMEAIFFCIIYFGFTPRIATESNNSAEFRLNKIRELIESSKYSIHDLSRSEASKKGETFRLNMPFELGIDYGCRQFFGNGRNEKTFLILDEKKFQYQKSLSDLSGCDVSIHKGDYILAIRKVRNWLVSEAGVRPDAPNKIRGELFSFQAWYVEKQRAEGFSTDDINDCTTKELMDHMIEWTNL